VRLCLKEKTNKQGHFVYKFGEGYWLSSYISRNFHLQTECFVGLGLKYIVFAFSEGEKIHPLEVCSVEF
jgi:hypothetical protein